MKTKIVLALALSICALGAQASGLKKNVTKAELFTCSETVTNVASGKSFSTDKDGNLLTVQVIDYGDSFTIISDSNGEVAQSTKLVKTTEDLQIGHPLPSVIMAKGTGKLDGAYWYDDGKSSIYWECLIDA